VDGPIVAAPKRALVPNSSQEATDKSLDTDREGAAPVYVVLWFDTEDYILPASDDAAKHIADFLTQQGIRATFKVVGEKARVLERRQRTDVIAALGRHEVGYHSNNHSQQPTVAEYESVLDWELGQEEFNRRERSGFDDVNRIFGKAPTCYGQPGVSWAPQAYPALKKWGINVYLDDGEHVQLDGKPFWYGGLLNIFHIQAGRQLQPNGDWSNLEKAKADFKTLYAEMSSRPPGGFVSFMFHPTQLVSKVFWDAVNFAHGANPPRSEWKLQAENSPEQTERAFLYFEGLITYIKSFPGVRFVTASEAYLICRDKAHGRFFNVEQIAEIASRVKTDITYQLHDNYAVAGSEVFWLLNSFTARFVNQGSVQPVKLDATPFGPSSPPYGVTTAGENVEVGWSQFSRTSVDVNEFIEKYQAMPNVVWFGSKTATPEAYLLALAGVTRSLVSKGKPPDSVKILPAELAAAQWVASDSPSIWEWPIFSPGFHSAHLMELARLQAWTIKPAIFEGLGSNESMSATSG
jgi:hypothetical protein